MKITLTAGISLLLLAAATPLTAVAYDEAGQLAPGVEIYRGGEAVEDDSAFYAHIVYTKDAPEKVLAFYRKSLGTEPVKGRSFYLGDDYTLSEMNDGGPLFLTITTASERDDESISASDLFDALEENQRTSRMMGSAEHDEQELGQLKQHYAHLARNWYPTIDVQEKLDACADEESEDSDDFADASEASAARIQELVAQGKYEEATSLVNDVAQAGMGVQSGSTEDRWDAWVDCYEELERNGYPVRVLIGKVHYRFTPPTQEGRANAIRDLGE